MSAALKFYRFSLTLGYIAHLFKSSTRQDHADLATLIRRYLPADGVAIDVGAHGGQVTRLLSGIAYRGLVVAVEPSGYARSILRAALFFRGRTNVVIAALALGASGGTMLIRTPVKRGRELGYGLANLVDGGGHFIAEPVAVVTMDSLVESLLLKRVDFIKVDIEGFEGELISGAITVLKTMRPALYMEMDDQFLKRAGSSLAVLWDRMTKLGYVPHEPRIRISGGPAMIADPSSGDILWLPSETI
jgi:FkbM family methyltransferase